MRESTSQVVSLPAATSQDVLTSILRDGAQRLLTQAIEAEVAEWINSHQHLKDSQGHRQVVRNGHLPKRTLMTGVGSVEVEEDRQCILVLMGTTTDGHKELIAIADGFRESEQSWLSLLLDVKARGLVIDPQLAVGDGALGF